MNGIFWVASYPKSGNTWTRSLIASLLVGGQAPKLSTLLSVCPNGAQKAWLETINGICLDDLTPQELTIARASAYKFWSDTQKSACCIKVHDAFCPRIFPKEITLGAIYVVRDPRDIAPSFAHHFDLDIDRAIDWMGRSNLTLARSSNGYNPQTEQVLGSWSSNVESWLKNFRGPLFLLRYEDLIQAPFPTVRKLADFLGLTVSNQEVANAVEVCRFEKLHAAEDAYGFNERLPHMSRFFRQGMSGKWMDALSSDSVEQIIRDHGDTMTGLGYLKCPLT